ncbi:MAG TPA: NAD-dependent epimerase/dehydratase family protein [Bacteroidia bacterium]|nr:NAD-dependent epimerase/dehydratase family protein [Bacteroidia bacterium]
MILVTGASGLLGSHVLLSLLKKGHQVKALATKEDSKNKSLLTFKAYDVENEKLFEKITWYEGSVTDSEFIFNLLEGVNQVYHCAAVVSFSPKEIENMNHINIQGTEVMVNMSLLRKVKKFCHVSSVAALGKTTDGSIVTEETYFVNSPQNSNYGISKYNAEREVWRASEEGLEVVIVNPSVILGPGDWQSGSSNMFRSAYKGLKYYSDGMTGFVDVRDVAQIMIQLMESPIHHQRYIVCAQNLYYADVFNRMHDCFGKPRPSIKASKILAALVWRLEKFKSIITGSNPLITKETVDAAFQKVQFSNKKITDTLSYQFIPINESIANICNIFKAQNYLGK